LEALEDIDLFTEPMCMWRDNYPFEIPVLEVEAPFEIAHPMDDSIGLLGRPDRVGVLWGQLFHVQNRSLAAGVNFGVYTELAKRHYHEHLYAHALHQKYPQYPYGGTIFNLLRKLKYRGVPTKKDPAGKILHKPTEILSQHMMMIDLAGPLHRHVMESLLKHIREMRETERRFREFGEWPAVNEKMNGGVYGNRVDEYFRVLVGELSLDDDRYFRSREDTYATPEQSPGD